MSQPSPRDSAPGFSTWTDDGIAWTEFRGKVDWELSSQALAKATSLADSLGTARLMFDIREAVHEDYLNLVLRHAVAAPELARRGFRIAVLGREGDRILAFIDDVAVNRAVSARTFTELDAALAWLRA